MTSSGCVTSCMLLSDKTSYMIEDALYMQKALTLASSGNRSAWWSHTCEKSDSMVCNCNHPYTSNGNIHYYCSRMSRLRVLLIAVCLSSCNCVFDQLLPFNSSFMDAWCPLTRHRKRNYRSKLLMASKSLYSLWVVTEVGWVKYPWLLDGLPSSCCHRKQVALSKVAIPIHRPMWEKGCSMSCILEDKVKKRSDSDKGCAWTVYGRAPMMSLGYWRQDKWIS